LGNLTNALISTESDENLKKATTVVAPHKNATKVENPGVKPVSSRTRAAAKSLTKGSKKVPLLPPPTKVITTAVKSKPAAEVSQKNVSRRISNEFEKTEESLYVSALEEIPSDVSRLSDAHRISGHKLESTSSTDSQSSSEYTLSSQASSEEERDDVFIKEFGRLPLGVEDFDKENWNDPYQVSNYAMQIFEYLKQREPEYKIKDYMSNQPELSKWMRSLLVDWMVEVQESFELNHETLYLAVKIVDTYLGKERVTKDSLQLLGAAALLIACKYDVSSSPFSV
jgi:G2/mitotic-specific cyclin-B3